VINSDGDGDLVPDLGGGRAGVARCSAVDTQLRGAGMSPAGGK
jgi:hypothetical protein